MEAEEAEEEVLVARRCRHMSHPAQQGPITTKRGSSTPSTSWVKPQAPVAPVPTIADRTWLTPTASEGMMPDSAMYRRDCPGDERAGHRGPRGCLVRAV